MQPSRVRRAADVVAVFQTPETEFEDNASDSEEELLSGLHYDYVEVKTASESENDAEFDDEWMELEEDCNETSAQSTVERTFCKPCVRSKSGLVWSRIAPDSSDSHSQIQYIASPNGEALNVTTPLEAWSILFSDEILNIIVNRTNEEIARITAKFTEKGWRMESYQKSVDLVELKAVIGLLYFAGLQKVTNTNTKNLWSPYGMSLFRLSMSGNRFAFLLNTIIFDDRNTRMDRKVVDRLANIREIWEMFITNCTANYQPHTNCTINEHLLPFRGICSFRTYVPGKQEKYGLKIVTLNDTTTHYMYSAIPDTGIVNADSEQSISDYHVIKVSEPIYHTGRNITCDDSFTSIPLCDKMKKDYNVTMVGAIRKNDRGIPDAFKKKPPAGTNFQFGYHDEKTLVSFNPEASKILLYLSSLHFDRPIDEVTGNPEIVNFYNSTKGGINSFNQKCEEYSTARKTRRWPLRYFYGMLDQAQVNCLILYTSCENNLKMKRTDFILDLSLALVKPLLSRRLMSSTLRTTLRVQIKAFLDYRNIPDDQDSRNLKADNKMKKQKRCSFCPGRLDRKTFHICLRCEQPMCREHVAKVCAECSIDMSEEFT